MNIVAVSTLSPHHRYVLEGLHQVLPLRCILQPVWNERSSDSASSRYAKLMKRPIATLTRRIAKWLEDSRDTSRDRRVLKSLGSFSSSLELDVERHTVLHDEINNEETVALIRRYEPDVIVTSGCPILKPEIFGIPRLATVNVHWGIAPAYRGENTLFWPLYFGDYENIGVTIHQIDEGIDTGVVLAHGFPELSPNDSEFTLFAKSGRIAAELLPEVLTRISRTGTINGMSTTGRGRLFLERDRTLVHDITYWMKRKPGRAVLPQAPARTVFYHPESPRKECLAEQETIEELSKS